MIVGLFLLGGVGAAARFWVDGAIRARRSDPMPVATMTINVVGSLLIGVLLGLQVGGVLAPDGFAMLATGFCGGFTTFSTAMVEAARLLQDGDVRRAWGSVALTLVLSVAAASAGVAVTSALT